MFRYLVLASATATSHAQIETVELELSDPERPERTVKAKFCAPSENGPHPLLVFGHGAGCAADDYAYFCQTAATAMVYQEDQVMSDFDMDGHAVDMKFLAEKLPEASRSDSDSPVYGLLDGTVVIGGHSMGASEAAMAAGTHGAVPDGLLLIAPGSAPPVSNVTVPALVVAGTYDCGPGAVDKLKPEFYDTLGSEERILMSLEGANHCQWTIPTEAGFGICKSVKECNGIERDVQQQLGNRLLADFLGALKGGDAWDGYEQALAKGEADGTWAYLSSKTSDAGKTVSNDCPCTPPSVV